MRYTKYSTHQSRQQNRRAAIFVDYENVFSAIKNRLGDKENPDVIIASIVEELRRYLIEELRTPTGITFAFGDFSSLGGNGQFISRSLSLLDVEPVFVPETIQANASEIRLCTDVMEVLHTRDDITTFAIVSGDRSYLPLMQHLKHYGRKSLLATVASTQAPDAITYIGEEVFLDACNLLSEPVRKMIGDEALPPQPNGSSVREPREDVVYSDISGEAAQRTLEIIEEHFGQYEEVYLTPLLRKLSELLGDEEEDPKSIINELEDAGAVWLEKRRGFPYDYTVLLLDPDHPEVARIQQEVYDRLEEDDEDYVPEPSGDGYYYDEFSHRTAEDLDDDVDLIDSLDEEGDTTSYDADFESEESEEVDHA